MMSAVSAVGGRSHLQHGGDLGVARALSERVNRDANHTVLLSHPHTFTQLV